jgi:multidrug efflux system membrane fusion protein
MNGRLLKVMTLPLFVCAAAGGCQQKTELSKPLAPVAVYDLPVTQVVTDYEEFPGQTDSIIYVQVRARVSGYMTSVYFKDGTYVEKDAKLFEIDPRPFMADRDRARGTVQQLEAHVARLEREYNRAKNLMTRGSISAEEHDRYEADYRESVASLEVAKANLKLAELNLEWTEVRAPCAGLLSRRLVDPGNLVKADDTVLTSIVSLDPLYVYFDVHEQAMLRIRRLIQEGKVKAQSEREVPVHISLSDEKDFPHEGIVDFTDNRVDINTGTLRFRAQLNNPKHFISPGLFVKIRLPIGDPHPALMIREQALISDQGEKKVYVIEPKVDEKGAPQTDQAAPVFVVAERKVQGLGVLRDGFREIQSGMKPNDRVVVSGMQRLRPGGVVRPERIASQPPKPLENTKVTANQATSTPNSGAIPRQPLAPPIGATIAGRPSSEKANAVGNARRFDNPRRPPGKGNSSSPPPIRSRRNS